ncbi:hypothetical protein MMC28_007275 [Mycoblastus sanguinarius]|nr:hypothetical protein [Mycoblastus sanguinarius]
MAEVVVGTFARAVTLAGLFKICIEAFDVIHTAQNQPTDLKKLALKLNIQKGRLYTWGEAMAITSMAEPRKQRPLELCPYPELIHETLDLILEVFRDSQKLKNKYGCASIGDLDAPTLAGQGPHVSVLRQFDVSFNEFDIKSSAHIKRTALAKKTYWVIRDRKKFGALIDEAKALIDGLEDITKDVRTRAVLQEMISSRIRNINDVRTLDWVSEVCEGNYPAFSDAASLRAETISEVSTARRDIQDWKDTIALEDDGDDSDSPSVETTIADIEEMTVTELKHKIWTHHLGDREARVRTKGSHMKDKSSTSSTCRGQTDEIESTTDLSVDKLLRELFHEHDIAIKSEMISNEDVLENMAAASKDKAFKEELDAISKRFNVLNPAQGAVIFYTLGENLSHDLDHTRFFARVQGHRLKSMSPPETWVEPGTVHFPKASDLIQEPKLTNVNLTAA